MSTDPFDIDPYTWEPNPETPTDIADRLRRIFAEMRDGKTFGWDFDPAEYFADNSTSPADADWHADRMDDRDQNWRAGETG